MVTQLKSSDKIDPNLVQAVRVCLHDELVDFSKDCEQQNFAVITEIIRTTIRQELKGFKRSVEESWDKLNTISCPQVQMAQVQPITRASTRRKQRQQEEGVGEPAEAVGSLCVNGGKEYRQLKGNCMRTKSIPIEMPPPSGLLGWIRWTVNHRLYFHWSGAVIVVNIFWLGFQADYMARNWVRDNLAWTHIDLFFSLFFIMDLMLRFIAHGLAFFTDFWNCYDFAVVAGVYLSRYLFTGGYKLVGITTARLFRIWRIIKRVEYFEKLRIIIVSILASLRALSWIFLLVVMLTYAVGVCLTMIWTEHKTRVGVYINSLSDPQQELEIFFGTVDSSMYTLYMAISEGIHWGEVASPLTEVCSPWFRLFFVSYMSFVLFAVMNVVTATFIEASLRVTAVEHQTDSADMLVNVLKDLIIVEGAEHVTREIFDKALSHPHVQTFLHELDTEVEEARDIDLFNLVDEDSSGSLELTEIRRAVTRLMGEARALDVVRLHKEVVEVKECVVIVKAMFETLMRASPKSS